MPLITPIYDRTNTDAQAVKTQIAAWLADPSNATVTDLKGALNPTDLNRIESNMGYLRDELNALGYEVSFTIKTNWTYSDYSDLTISWRPNNIDRILSNLAALAAHMPISYITRPVPSSMIFYNQINDIEYIQYQINQFIVNMIESYRYSGTVISGDWVA